MAAQRGVKILQPNKLSQTLAKVNLAVFVFLFYFILRFVLLLFALHGVCIFVCA